MYKERRRARLWLIPLVGIMLLLSVVVVAGFAAGPAPAGVLRPGQTVTAPAGFGPQLVQNRYLGGEAALGESGELVLSCGQYRPAPVVLPGGRWYRGEEEETYYLDGEENGFFGVRADLSSKTLRASFTNENGELVTLEAETSDALAGAIRASSAVDPAKTAALKGEDPEKNVVFFDAQIDEILPGGRRATYYNVADEGWTSYTDAQIAELKSYCDSRDKKNKLKVELMDTVTGYWNRDFENVTEYLPKWLFFRDGKSAFIGNEYGFIADIEEDYDEGKSAYIYTINSFILFSLDRKLEGREYAYTVEILLNSNGTVYVEKNYTGIYTQDDYKIRIDDDKYSGSHLLLADPSMSVAIHNLYDLNEFNEGYAPEQDKTISISQVRMNYSGYHGKKQKKKLVSAKEVMTSIYSMGDKAYGMADTIVDIVTQKKILEHIASAANIAGKAAGVILKANPYVAIASAALDIGKEIYDLVDGQRTVFAKAEANNEANIMTFPAPSEEATKNAVARFGIKTPVAGSDNNESLDHQAVKSLAFQDGDEAEFVLRQYGDYAQSIFMLNEVTKPTALTSYLDLAFALDNSGAFNSNVQKFHIPARFNYSERTTRLFDEGNAEQLSAGESKSMSFFGSTGTDVQFSVAESGYYDFTLDRLSKTAKVRVDTSDVRPDNPFERENNVYVPYAHSFDRMHIDEAISLDKIFGAGTVTYLDADGDGYRETARLFLTAETDSVFRLDAGKGSASEMWYGATFEARLLRHYDAIGLGKTVKTLQPNQKQYYTFVPGETGVYKFSGLGPNAAFDLYAKDFVSVQLNQKKIEAILTANQTYYVCVKNSGGSVTAETIDIAFECEAASFDYASGLRLQGGLSGEEKVNIYTIELERPGTYTFVKEEAYDVQVKDAQLRECLFGADKAHLKQGRYYVAVRCREEGSQPLGYDVGISFTPRAVTVEKDYILGEEAYFTFVAKENGDYRFGLAGEGYAVDVDGFAESADGVYSLVAGRAYIGRVRRASKQAGNVTLRIAYFPDVYKTFNETFNDKIVQLGTDLSGYYYFSGDELALYDETLGLINRGSDFTQQLFEGKKYFVINRGAGACEVVFDCETVTVNFEVTIKAGDRFLKFTAPEDGIYDLRSYYDNGTTFAVYAYNQLSRRVPLTRGDSGYALRGGAVYYIGVKADNTDFVTVKNGSITALPEIPEDTLAEVELDDQFNYAASYRFNPSVSGEYTFIFNRNLKKDFSILIGGQSYTFAEGQNILKLPVFLEQGSPQEISFNLLSFGNATLVFGVYRQPKEFDAYVSDRLQTGSGAVNKIAVGEDKNGFVSEQISVGGIEGRAAYNRITFTILNTPYIDGRAGVSVDETGRLTVSNALPQWTAFAVEINVGRYVYGDVALSPGVSRVVNFLIYVDVTDIKILDENDNPIYQIDLEHKASMDLTAKVFPAHAAQADKLQYHIGEADKQYVTLSVSGNKAVLTANYTTPNKHYVKIQASCGSEFTVVIMVRVYAKQIYASSADDLAALSEGSATAYEIIVNGTNLGTQLVVPARVKYLKIRAGSKAAIFHFSIKVQSDQLTMVLDSLAVYGNREGLIMADNHDLVVHFKGAVSLYGWDGNGSYNAGACAVTARDLHITKEGDNPTMIYGGDGYGFPEAKYANRGGDGGDAIAASGLVMMRDAENIVVVGGRGGSGSAGMAGASVNIYPSERDTPAEQGKNGYNGGKGGDGGSGIVCQTLVVYACQSIDLKGGPGGNGGRGGNGSLGGNGGKGHDSDGKRAAEGQPGGRGGDGGNGGDGGCGGAALSGNLNITDSTISLKAGNGGNAGAGGHAANGGRGGDGGDDVTLRGSENVGGRGGDGGNGGQPGTRGTKGMAVSDKNIFMYGTCGFGQVAAADGSSALVGYKGYGGEGGDAGNPGDFDKDIPEKADYGSDGTGRERN